MPETKVSWTRERLEYLLTLIAETYVKQENGKGLSANDFTTALLNKLNNIETGAEVNAIETVSLNGTGLSPDANRNVNISLAAYARLANPEFTGVPTAPTPTTATNTQQVATTAFVHSAVDAAIAGLKGIQQVFVQNYASLPVVGDSSKIYYVANGSNGDNMYDEYVWLEGKNGYEKRGSADVDLSGYMRTADWPIITENEIDAFFS